MYKVFKYWTLIMFLVIIPLTPILITIFGFNQIEQHGLDFLPILTLNIISRVSSYFLWLSDDVFSSLLGNFPNNEWLNSFNSSADLFFGLFNNNIISLNFVDGILSFNLSAFNDLFGPRIDFSLDIEEWASSFDNVLYYTFYISEFSIDKLWWVVGISILIIIVTIITSILWAYFSKFNEKNSWGEPNFK